MLSNMGFTLQLLLLALVVLAVLGLRAWWRARRSRPPAARLPSDNPRTEPGLGAVAEVDAGGATSVSSLAPMPAVPVLRRHARLDPLIDAIATLSFDSPVAGETLLQHWPVTRRAGSKPFYIEALSSGSGEYEAPLPGQRYTEVQAGVQMANRSGAINEIEYSEFVQKVQAFADAVGAEAEFADMLDVVARGRELDAFAAPLDAQLTLTLRAASVAWSVGFVQQAASRHGFVAGALPGRLVLPSNEDHAPPILVLSFDAQAALADDPQTSALREVALSLDVAQSPQAAEPFPQWQRCATRLADELDATVVDDNGQPVTIGAYDQISRELAQLYAALESRDLAAGSAAARRLFS